MGVENAWWGSEMCGGWSKQVGGGCKRMVEVRNAWWVVKTSGWGSEMHGGGWKCVVGIVIGCVEVLVVAVSIVNT
jgi:uncharacterized iron-regulated membrane protein